MKLDGLAKGNAPNLWLTASRMTHMTCLLDRIPSPSSDPVRSVTAPGFTFSADFCLATFPATSCYAPNQPVSSIDRSHQVQVHTVLGRSVAGGVGIFSGRSSGSQGQVGQVHQVHQVHCRRDWD
jgi:hypothetical protein